MNPELLLRLAYGFNILLLTPVLYGLVTHQGPGVLVALGGNIANSDGLRWLVISLWSGVAVASAIGLYLPRLFIPLLIFQVVYKSIFLGAYVLPLAVRGDWINIPFGPTIFFLLIVLAWPFIIARAMG